MKKKPAARKPRARSAILPAADGQEQVENSTLAAKIRNNTRAQVAADAAPRRARQTLKERWKELEEIGAAQLRREGAELTPPAFGHFTAEEYQQLMDAARRAGETIPMMLDTTADAAAPRAKRARAANPVAADGGPRPGTPARKLGDELSRLESDAAELEETLMNRTDMQLQDIAARARAAADFIQQRAHSAAARLHALSETAGCTLAERARGVYS